MAFSFSCEQHGYVGESSDGMKCPVCGAECYIDSLPSLHSSCCPTRKGIVGLGIAEKRDGMAYTSTMGYMPEDMTLNQYKDYLASKGLEMADGREPDDRTDEERVADYMDSSDYDAIAKPIVDNLEKELAAAKVCGALGDD